MKIPTDFFCIFCDKEEWQKEDGTRLPIYEQWDNKNSYPPPLILDFINTVESKKVFTKLDLWWGYNNVRIKKGNEWKIVFKMSMGSSKPTVMFFGLTNSLAMFQAIINNIMRISQISYSLVVILELSGVLEVQYKEIMMSSINKNN